MPGVAEHPVTHIPATAVQHFVVARTELRLRISLLDVAIRRCDLKLPGLFDVRNTLDLTELFDFFGVDRTGYDPSLLQLLLDIHAGILETLDDLCKPIQMLVVNGDQQVHLGHFATFSRLSNQIIPAHPQDGIAKPLRDLLKGLTGKDELHTSAG
jgi:hypothetical protein